LSAAAAGRDRNGDGIPDYADPDEAEGFEGLPGEGASSAAAAGRDRDGDGIPDYADADQAEDFEGLAGEGASSAAAGGRDRDGDGIPDYADSDEAEDFEGLAGESAGTRWGRHGRSAAGAAGGVDGTGDAHSSQVGDDSDMDSSAADGDADGMDEEMADAEGASGTGSKSGSRSARRSARGGDASRGGAGTDGSSLAGDSDAADGQSGVVGADGLNSSGSRSGRTSGRHAMAAGRDGSGEDGDGPDSVVVGMVDAPGQHVRVDEEVTAQTLGGMLPLVLGVDEQGEFDFDQAVLRPEVKTVLDDLASKLEDAEYDRLDIVGYTDRIGSPEYNQSLSERRAWAVARYLMDKGVPLDKLRVAGRGERESILQEGECADLGREQLITCLQRDRRVQIEASIRKSSARVQ
jgi:outer membrane protein OmpA-like peptidoglycan-associated protein